MLAKIFKTLLMVLPLYPFIKLDWTRLPPNQVAFFVYGLIAYGLLILILLTHGRTRQPERHRNQAQCSTGNTEA